MGDGPLNATVLWKGPNALGEGPLWHERERVLYWIDIAEPSLHRLDPRTNIYRYWPLPEPVGTVVPHARKGVVLTLGSRIVRMDIPSGRLTTMAEMAPWHPAWRMNDGKCDAAGRLWFGVAHVDEENPSGGLFRLDLDGTLTQMEKHITISNGLGWSPDYRQFYYTDGLRYRIYVYDFDMATGTLSNRRIFLQLEKSPIEPDGLTIDSQGYIWEAQWNSGKIFRYSPAGETVREIALPIQRPTSCMFGGEHFDTLYVTSCSQGLGETTRLPPPAGAVFALDVGVKGLPEPAFGEER